MGLNKRSNRICQRNDGFDNNCVLDLREKKWVLNEHWNRICQKNDRFDNNGVSDLIKEREKKDGFWTNNGIEFAQ